MPKVYDPILCMMVDEPTKARDAKKEEGFKILSAIIRGEKLVLTFEDLLNSPGKKETMEFTKKEAEAFKKDPWNTWTGNTKSIVEKFIGSKVHDSASALDKAIKTVDGVTGDKLYANERQNVRKAIQLLKNAASLVNNVAMDVDNRRLGGVVNNIQNDISILEDML